eukprot:TRINITY_DN11215_c0_g1_i1.p1 TRINITY_DN11215_c0_g1~~TRINITY_DN11215_c0_g1_i1.p1  ORF type:complete len:337 (+),score=125.96 TRINITY_DN11215_c0_g1_i1:73-1083(+)
MGRKSRSRSRGRKEEKKEKKAEASKKEEKKKKPPVASEDSEEDMSLEAKVALLEVENETLKAENRELRKKLVAALRRGSGSDGGNDGGGERRRAKPASPARSPPRKKQASPPKKAPPKKEESEESEEEAPRHDNDAKNAVLLSNDIMEVYNERVPNNIAMEKRMPLVNKKIERFLENFSEKIQILDLKSGGAIVKDMKTFKMRFGCVFRESGERLKGTCHKRFYYDAMHRATYVLDFETHEYLVTATPGTRPDGSLGVRDPRTEHLVVLYEEQGGKITRMWLKQDTDKFGLDPTMGEEVLTRTDVVKAFEKKIEELRGGPAAPRIFQNYHDIPTIG